jgi:hypothetical protein
MSRLLALSLAAGLVAGTASIASAQDRSPIFGTAGVKTLTTAENKGVKAKGYYADYYGYLGLSDLSTATTYGQYAYYYAPSNSATEYSYYFYAYQAASSASTNFYYAYVYSYYGY